MGRGRGEERRDGCLLHSCIGGCALCVAIGMPEIGGSRHLFVRAGCGSLGGFPRAPSPVDRNRILLGRLSLNSTVTEIRREMERAI